jgi:hypothetical protein
MDQSLNVIAEYDTGTTEVRDIAAAIDAIGSNVNTNSTVNRTGPSEHKRY